MEESSSQEESTQDLIFPILKEKKIKFIPPKLL